MKPISALKTTLLAAAAVGAMASAPAYAASHSVGACLITKTDTNPFFVKMKEGADRQGRRTRHRAEVLAGKVDGDHETQVAAIETCIADGAKGILLTASDTSSIVRPSAGPRRRPSGDRARHPARPDRRRRRDLRHRQLQGRRADRPVGRRHARRRRRQRQDRHARPRRQPADRRRAARPGLPAGLRHRLGDPNKWGDETIRASSATT
jgi:hypothetical protein